MAAIGDNSIAADELRLLVERIERIEGEEKELRADKKDVYAEGKSRGYDAATMRKIVRLRKMEPHDRQEQQALLETYLAALGIS